MDDERLQALDLDPALLATAPLQCVCFNTRKAARAITQLYAERMRAFELTVPQFSLLIAVALHGDAGLAELAKGLATDRTTLTRNVKPLIKSGLIRQVPGANNRIRAHELTPQGAKTLREALPVWQEIQRDIMARIGADRFEVLRSFADDMVEMSR